MLRLPVDDVLADVTAAIRAGRDVVVLAPPGAGKTTRVPAAIAEVVEKRVLVLEPRRLAARLAAARLAEELGTKVGDRVGYQVRFDDRTSKNTKIALLTEGILTRRMQSDPLLEDVDVVVLDEFHERSVHADLAIAFLREAQSIRPELRIVVMSATLDPTAVLAFLHDTVLVKSDGRLYPVDVRYLEQRDERRLEDIAVSGVRRALRETDEGDILTFLPGAPEIRRVQQKLGGFDLAADIVPLYGELDAKAQDRAVVTGPRRKVILATNIAESSLTIPGVRIVVDSGYEKLLRHDVSTGLDRLDRVRISLRSAEQRAGRAGRLGPGVAYRLWSQKEEIGFSKDIAPEVFRIELSRVVLDVLTWSASDPTTFGWFEAPPAAAIERATKLLVALGAIRGWRRTPLGEKIAKLPLEPRVGAILAASAEASVKDGALVAAIASERDILRRVREADTSARSDLLVRYDLLRALDHGGIRPSDADALGIDIGAAQNVLRVRDRLVSIAKRTFGRGANDASEDDLLRAILAGFPDRVARRTKGDRYRMADGGGRLSPSSVVKNAELIVAIDVDAKRGDPMIRVASAVERDWLDLEEVKTARWNPEREAAEARIETRHGDLVVDDRADQRGDPDALHRTLVAAAAADLDRALPITDDVFAFLNRCAFLRRARPELERLPTADTRRELLDTIAYGKKSFAQLQKVDLVEALRQHLDHETRTALDRDAPKTIRVPSGRVARLRYDAEGPPVCAVRLQEVFGLYETPRVGGGRVPLKMELLAPNMRPVQVTQDLASFWANTYADVRKDLRARYPKHQWPEDPKDGVATTRVRPRRR